MAAAETMVHCLLRVAAGFQERSLVRAGQEEDYYFDFEPSCTYVL